MMFGILVWLHSAQICRANELIVANSERDILKDEISSVLDNLGDAIITRTQNCLGHCNGNGTKLLK